MCAPRFVYQDAHYSIVGDREKLDKMFNVGSIYVYCINYAACRGQLYPHAIGFGLAWELVYINNVVSMGP